MEAACIDGITRRLWPDRPRPVGWARVECVPAGLQLRTEQQRRLNPR